MSDGIRRDRGSYRGTTSRTQIPKEYLTYYPYGKDGGKTELHVVIPGINGGAQMAYPARERNLTQTARDSVRKREECLDRELTVADVWRPSEAKYIENRDKRKTKIPRKTPREMMCKSQIHASTRPSHEYMAKHATHTGAYVEWHDTMNRTAHVCVWCECSCIGRCKCGHSGTSRKAPKETPKLGYCCPFCTKILDENNHPLEAPTPVYHMVGDSTDIYPESAEPECKGTGGKHGINRVMLYY